MVAEQFDKILLILSTMVSKYLTRNELERLLKVNDSSIKLKQVEQNDRAWSFWPNFNLVFVNEIVQNFAQCNKCQTIIVYNISINLWTRCTTFLFFSIFSNIFGNDHEPLVTGHVTVTSYRVTVTRNRDRDRDRDHFADL